MTTVIATKSSIGGDRGISYGDSTFRTEPKVWRAGGALWGGAGDAHAVQVLKSWSDGLMDVSSAGELEVELREFRDEFKEWKDFWSEPVDFSMLVVPAEGGILLFDASLQVYEIREEFFAIGSGAPYALGFLHGTAHPHGPPLIEPALETAAHFDSYTSAPFDILELL